MKYMTQCRDCGTVYAPAERACPHCLGTNGDNIPSLVNLTQHHASNDQRQVGVVDWADARLAYAAELSATTPVEDGAEEDWLNTTSDSLAEVLTFDRPTPSREKRDRARALAARVAEMGYGVAMVGGKASFIMALSEQLALLGVLPVEAFSRRESVEAVQPDGTVRKTMVFRHEGWDALMPRWHGDSSYQGYDEFNRLEGAKKAMGLE